MLIWRVENSEGIGPYWGNFAPQYQKVYLYDKVKHPRPKHSGRDIHYGFTSFEQLKAWFEETGFTVLEDLKAAGYNVVQYEIDEQYVNTEEKHISFYHEKAKLLSSNFIDLEHNHEKVIE